jgi:hypothetical protein
MAEGLLNGIRPRTSKYIWHTIEGEFLAVGDDVSVRAKLRVSAFPSHGLWVNGEPRPIEPQGPFNALWDPLLSDPTRVRE